MIYAIGSYKAAKTYGALNESKFPNDFAASVLAETALGPFFVGGSVGDSGHHKWFFQLGHVFWNLHPGSQVVNLIERHNCFEVRSGGQNERKDAKGQSAKE